VHPERCRTFREHNLDAGLPSRTSLTKLLQPSKLRKARFFRSPMDGWTYDRFMHPVKSSRSIIRLPEKFGVSTRHLELLRSTLFKQRRFCEKRMSNQLLSTLCSNLNIINFLFLRVFFLLKKYSTVAHFGLFFT